VSEKIRRLYDNEGQEVDAAFSVESVGEATSLIFESMRGSPPRNTQYMIGLELLLARLAARGAVLVDIAIDTQRTQELPIAQRRLDLGRPLPFPLAEVANIHKLRLAISRSQAQTARAPGSRGTGNSTKRLRIYIELPSYVAPSALADQLAHSRPPESDKQRSSQANPKWTQDELLLAFATYVRFKPRQPPKGAPELKKLVRLLQSYNNQRNRTGNAQFRNEASVYRRMMNIKARDPEFSDTKGLDRLGSNVQAIIDDHWQQYARKPRQLLNAAQAIEAIIRRKAVAKDEGVDPDEELAPEGAQLTKLHRYYERVSKNRNRKIESVLAALGNLACEACGFDFAKAYGTRGKGYIECHHVLSVSELSVEKRPTLRDLRLVCSNCHRMIHRRRPWATVEEVAAMVAKR